MEETGWQLDLVQLRRLMRNEVTNHERIRSRILSLQERYFEGEMGDNGVSWSSWALAYFAYSPRHLKYLSSPHPLSLDKWDKQQQDAQAKIAREQQKQDAQRSQAVWDALRDAQKYDAARSQAAWDLYKQEQETKAVVSLNKEKEKTEKAKNGNSRSTLLEPVAIAIPYILEVERLDCKNRVDIGRQYYMLRELAGQNKLGKNEKGRYWAFNPWCIKHIKRTRQDVYKCIEAYEKFKEEQPSAFEGLRIVT